MENFKESEFACRCCGQLPPSARENIRALVDNVLDPARRKLGKPVFVNSGYRCEKHNTEVGGVANSQHMKGEAADLRIDGKPEKLARIIVENGVYDQVIVYSTFVHVSYKKNGVNRKQILKKTASGYQKISINDIK